MSSPDYSQLTTSDLLQRFGDAAKRAGWIFTKDRKKLQPTPQRGMLVQQMQALGAELRKRKPIEQIRELFVDKDPDVRSWAGAQFGSVDPEWAGATLAGLFHKLTTHEVLAWRRRILQRPSQKPDLQKMSTTQLVERFVDACERCYGTTRFLTDEESGGVEMTAHNKVRSEVKAIARELHRRSELQALVPLFDHPIITVRQEAAGYSLPVATDQAITTLEAVEATKDDPEFGSASFTLDRWRDGTYGPFKIIPRPTQS
jgi:Domain of unknown function (DUF2019)